MDINGLTGKLRSVLTNGDNPNTSSKQDDLRKEGTTKATQFRQMLESRGGRMKQATLVSETQWSAATVSLVLSEMEARGQIQKISVGRENVITLVGSEPEWYDPPDSSTSSSTPTTETAEEPDSDQAILLVEDEPQAGRLLKEAFQEANIAHSIHIVRDGLDAVDFLLQQDGYTDAPRPVLVLLDLTLEVVDGIEVLAELEEETGLAGIPVLVLSQSDASTDIHRSYANGATAYLKKPDNFEGLVDLARAIDTFWFTHAELPDQQMTDPQVGETPNSPSKQHGQR